MEERREGAIGDHFTLWTVPLHNNGTLLEKKIIKLNLLINQYISFTNSSSIVGRGMTWDVHNSGPAAAR